MNNVCANKELKEECPSSVLEIMDSEAALDIFGKPLGLSGENATVF